MVLGFGLAFAGLAAISIGAAALTRRLRFRRPALDVVAWWFLTVHLLTVVVLLHGMSGTLSRAPLLASAVVVGALGALDLRRQRARWPARPAALVAAAGRHPWLAAAVLGLAGAQLLRELVHVWLLPPYVWDTLTYHLPRVAEWIQAGGFVAFDTPTTRSQWPANHELLQLWLMIFPRHDALIDAAGLPFQAAAALCVYAIVRRLGVRRTLAAVAALAYAGCPAVSLQATSGKNDLPIAAAFLFCVALLLDLRTRRGGGLRHLLWMLLVLALSFGTKPYIAFLAPGLVVIGLFCRPSLVRRAPRRVLGLLRRAPVSASVYVLSLALVGGYWYARNYARFGDPFYPTNLQLFGETVFDGEKGRFQQNTASLESLERNLRMTFRRKVLDDRSAFNAELNDMSCWGWFVAGFGIPALLAALRRPGPLRMITAGFVVSMLVLLSWVAPDPWNLRFVLWLPALAAMAWAVVMERLPASPGRVAWAALAALAMGLDLVGSLGGSMQDRDVWIAMAALPAARRSTANLGYEVGYIDVEFAAALDLVPKDEPIGYHTHKDGGIYALYDADASRQVVFVPLEAGRDVAASMRERGVRFLFVTHERNVVREMLSEAVAGGRLRQVGRSVFALPR